MKLINTTKELKDTLSSDLTTDNTLGLVPTMGALHQGHLSLVNKSVELCDYSVVTIFVNPSQFNNLDDLNKYPRTPDQDLQLLESSGCNVVFIPSVEEMYLNMPKEPKLDLGLIESVLEGEHRPGHFQGVGTIVSKFFEIVHPTHAFFGQKDLQQFHVIKSIIHRENLSIKLIQIPIIRETSGLAMSSRNSRLNVEEKKNAALIYKTLQYSKRELLNGAKISNIIQEVENTFSKKKGMNLEYFQLVETENFSAVSTLNYDSLALCIAVNVGDVRLIDNILIFS